LTRSFDTSARARPAAVVCALVAFLQPAHAFTLHCTPDTADAQALCSAFGDILTNADRQTGTILQMDVQNLRPASIRVALTLTAADGRRHVVNRGLSAHDTTIKPAMQAAFLKKLLAAIPPDF
jgi:hypothetical protein